MEDRLKSSGFPEFAEYFFNAIPDLDFVKAINRLKFGIGVGYNSTRCRFHAPEGAWQKDFEGVAFSIFDKFIFVRDDEFDSMILKVCETQKIRCPEQSTAIDAALLEPPRYRLRRTDGTAADARAPSLFRPNGAPPVSIDENLWVLEVNENAHELDRSTSAPKTSKPLASETSLRRAVLAGLESRGLLSSEHAETKLFWLDVWAMSKLVSYFHAALALEAYRASAARRSRFPEPAEAKPSVSLDWFRNGIEPPPGRDADEWLALCEHTLLDAIARGRITSSPPSYEGELFERTKAGWFELRWRRDDGETPVVVSAKLS